MDNEGDQFFLVTVVNYYLGGNSSEAVFNERLPQLRAGGRRHPAVESEDRLERRAGLGGDAERRGVRHNRADGDAPCCRLYEAVYQGLRPTMFAKTRGRKFLDSWRWTDGKPVSKPDGGTPLQGGRPAGKAEGGCPDPPLPRNGLGVLGVAVALGQLVGWQRAERGHRADVAGQAHAGVLRVDVGKGRTRRRARARRPCRSRQRRGWRLRSPGWAPSVSPTTSHRPWRSWRRPWRPPE